MIIALLIAAFAAFFAVYVHVAKRELAKAKADVDEARAESERLRRLYVELKTESDKTQACVLLDPVEAAPVAIAPPALLEANVEAHSDAGEILISAKREAAAESARIIGAARIAASEMLSQAEAESKKQNLTWRQADHWAEKFRLLEEKANREIARQSSCEMELLAAKNELDAMRNASTEAATLRKSLLNVAGRFLKEMRAASIKDMTSSNYAATAKRMNELLVFLSKNSVTTDEPELLMSELRARYAEIARAEAAREEQLRIKALIREEIVLQRERDAELKRLAAQEKAVREALAKAESDHSGEVDRLRARLGELEGAIVRAKSQAELTKAGHVYVLSNIGSFGEGVFKVGMTRRLEPLERVTELGDASVPFPFDVHMMISCEDAPALEKALHHALNEKRLNKVNLRKEFFRTDVAELAALVESSHGKVEYVAEPEALQYRDSQAMTEADFAFVAGVQSQPEEDVSEN